MNLKPLAITLAVSALTFTPVLPVFDLGDGGAAYAEKGGKGGGKGGGNGGGNGGGKGKSEGKGKADAKGKAAKAEKKANPAATKVKATKAKAKTTVEGELAPNELGKMNGAMHANNNAVLAHIRNGQTTNGPVGLLAGLAIADSAAAEAATAATEMADQVADFDALDTALGANGYATVEDYLDAKADGTATDEQIAALDPLAGAVEGKTRPTDAEIAAAEAAAKAAGQGVTDAETAIGDAWNKDGDLEALLGQLRERLAADQEAIDAAIAETQAEDDMAAVIPEAEVVPEGEVIVVVE